MNMTIKLLIGPI